MFARKGQDPQPVVTPPDPLSHALVSAVRPLMQDLRAILLGAILFGGILGGMIGGLLMWALSAAVS